MAATSVPRWQTVKRRLSVRLMAAMLLVSLPLMVVLAVLLTTGASSSLTSAGEQKGINIARAVALHVEDWLSERQENLSVIADQSVGQLNAPATAELLARIDKTYGDFVLIEVADSSGRVIASSRSGVSVDPTGTTWFQTATSGQPAVSSPVRQGDHVQWMMAQPVIGGDGRVQGVVAAELNPAVLPDLLNPELDQVTTVLAVDANHQVVYDTTMGKVADDSALLAAGGLQLSLDNTATRQAIASGQTGTARFVDLQGRSVIGGYDIVDGLHWVVLAEAPTSKVLAPVNSQRSRATLIVALGALIAISGALGLAWRTTRPVRRLTEAARRASTGDLSVRVRPEGSTELVTLAESFNAMLETCQRLVEQMSSAGVEVNSAASELSASSDELAATTTQQSAAVTQATATTEELARASAAIADTVDEVSRQTAETRDNLEQAKSDIALSSERTLALAGRVRDIDGLLELINDIADQTNLLALNAAIEAARAGENGLGFAVVADEVRRLAERSKSSAGDIAEIVEAIQGETNATVMAMEKGTKQMQEGLALLEAVTDSNTQVRLTTQQQRSATAQVVETMEQLTDACRQVSLTAQQIASAAGNLADLAGNLETTAAAARERY